MRARSDGQIDVRLRHVELLEEDVRHLCVIVLSGVDQSLAEVRSRPECAHDRRSLHEIRTSADNMEDMHLNS